MAKSLGALSKSFEISAKWLWVQCKNRIPLSPPVSFAFNELSAIHTVVHTVKPISRAVSGQTGTVEIQLHRHQEGAAALEKSIAETGSATFYGIHFDTDSAKLRADSAPALEAILRVDE